MSDLQTSPLTLNATSLPASVAGPSLLDKRVIPIIKKFGLEAVLASLSPRRAADLGLLMIGISGPSGAISSRSAALQSSLESRLRPLLTGSDLCEVIWKPWTTPWGQCLSRPRARVRTISETDTGLWATATSHERTQTPRKVHHGAQLANQAASLWPTTTTRDHKDGIYQPNVAINGLLGRMVWPTPHRNCGTGPGTQGRIGGQNLQTAALWATIRATDGEKGGPNMQFGAGGQPLPAMAAQALYPTPSASGFEAKNPQRLLERRQECKERTNNGNGFGLTLGQFATISSGSSAPTEKRGALNPEFVCWLMGYPVAWLFATPAKSTGTRASRRSKVSVML